MNRDGDRNQPFRLSHALLLLMLAAAWLAATGRVVGAADDLTRREARVEGMTPDEKEQLWRKYERFRVLPAAEQSRLRALDAQLEQDADGAGLRQVLENYQRWLEGLSSAERAELMALETEERLKRIAQLRAEEARRLSSEDAQAFARWFEALLIRQRPELEARLAPPQRAAERRIQIRMTIEQYLFRWRSRGPRPPADGPPKSLWNAEDFAQLREALSEKAQRQLDQAAGPLERRKLINGWLRQVYWQDSPGLSLRRFSSSLSEERLREFFDKELDAAQRARLLSLPLDQMQRQLRQLYWQRHPPARRRPTQSSPPTASGGSQVQR